MKVHGDISIGQKRYSAGDSISWYQVYPFFLVHMLMFGGSGFLMAYGDAPVLFLYLHGGLAVLVYTVFYLAIFGRDEVKWMFINAALGLFGIWSQIDWMLSLFGRSAGDYPVYRHVIPFLYFILYTFLLHNAVLDLTQSREKGTRKQIADKAYIVGSIVVYAGLYFLGR